MALKIKSAGNIILFDLIQYRVLLTYYKNIKGLSGGLMRFQNNFLLKKIPIYHKLLVIYNLHTQIHKDIIDT